MAGIKGGKMKIKEMYFIKQKLLGVFLIILAALSVKVTDDLTAALLLAPVGIYAVLTKEMVITDSYFFECKERK